MLYNDRIFFNFNEFYRFSSDHVLTIVEQELRLFEKILDEEYNVVQEEVGQNSLDSGKFVEAKSLLKDLVLSDELTDFLTLPAYRSI